MKFKINNDSIVSVNHIADFFDAELDNDNNKSDQGNLISFVETCEIGDTFINHYEEIEITRIE